MQITAFFVLKALIAFFTKHRLKSYKEDEIKRKLQAKNLNRYCIVEKIATF